jgi:hypothetical protein
MRWCLVCRRGEGVQCDLWRRSVNGRGVGMFLCICMGMERLWNLVVVVGISVKV